MTLLLPTMTRPALYILQALEAEGLKCPDDVALTGFDNSSLAEACMVPLTTIAHPQEKLGSMAAEFLLRLMNGEEMGQQDKEEFLKYPICSMKNLDNPPPLCYHKNVFTDKNNRKNTKCVR